jgi:hypothetical protein
VVWIDWVRRKVLGVLGQADQPGGDLDHLRQPAQVAIHGERAAIADAGNQRIVKVLLRP